MTSTTPAKEAVGERQQLDLIKHAQRMTWQAVERIAQAIRPGIAQAGHADTGRLRHARNPASPVVRPETQ